MTNQNPATPPNGAAPGTPAQVPATIPAATPPATPAQGNNQEGQVTIPTKEYAQLQRDSARVRSFEKRKEFQRSRNNPQPANGDQDDPANERISQLETETADANKRALQAEIKGSVRDVLDKEEFKPLPRSTRELILKNPHMLSNADNLEEALLDIEDFVRDQVGKLDSAPAQQPHGQQGAPSSGDPAGHETPAKVGAGVPSQTSDAGLEDTSNLRGVSLSRATLRNAIKKKKQGQ